MEALMLRRVLLVMAGVSLGVSGLQAQMMQIPPVRNAPFEAVNSLTVSQAANRSAIKDA